MANEYVSWGERLQKASADLVKKYNIKAEELTEFQVAEALRQAIACGDFQKNLTRDGAQSVVYVPYNLHERALTEIRDLQNALREIKSTLSRIDI